MAEYRSGARLQLEMDNVSIQQLRSGSGAAVLLANGFLSQSVTGWDRWKRAVTQRYPEHPVFRVRWEAQALESLKPLEAAVETGGDPGKLLAEAKRQITGPIQALLAGKRPDMPLPAVIVEAPAKWAKAKQRATETGIALAEAIKDTDESAKFILTGFSLGARVMASAALHLAELGITNKIEAIHLVGAAISRSDKWQPITEVAEQGVWNYFSKNDGVLSALYRIAEGGATPFGLAGMHLAGPKAHDVDVSSAVFTHRGYLPVIDLD